MRLRDLVQPGRILVLALGVALLTTGCRSHRAADAKSGPEQIYAKAQKAIPKFQLRRGGQATRSTPIAFPHSANRLARPSWI